MALDQRGTNRITNVVICVLALLLTHEISYLLASWFHSGHDAVVPGHQHQNWLLALAGPVALVGAAVAIVQQARRLGLSATGSHGQLTAATLCLYLVQETAEVLADGPGIGALLANRAVLVGLVVAPLVSTLLIAVMTNATKLARMWLSTDEPLSTPSIAQPGPSGETWVGAAFRKRSQPRAPPAVYM